MKRILTAILAMILLLGCFAGCKKDTPTIESTGTASTNATPGANTDATTPAPAPTPNGLLLEENGVVYESLAQKAVVKTALAYLARSTRIQYDDTRMIPKGAPESSGVLYRWQSGVRKSPEEYTSQYTGYTNCAAFTNEVYRAALDCSSGANNTDQYATLGGATRAYRYNPTGKETAEEQAAIQEKFLTTLKMGDIIVVRRHNGTGHAMLYVGSQVLEGVEGYKGAASEGTSEDGVPNDAGYIYDIIHSTGSSYVYDKQTEKYEKYGSIQITAANSLFDSKSNSYVFGKLTSLTIIRPLNTFNDEVPENSLNRMINLHNVVVEKLSSHTAGMTVNPGGNISYSFSIVNKNETDVTLEVKDTVPENTTLVTADGGTVDGANLSWTVTVPAKSSVTVGYVVQVNADAPIGSVIGSDAGTVGGVLAKCPKTYVGTTLTEAQQTALLSAITAHADSNLRGMALANAIYNDVLDTKDLLADDIKTVLTKLFRKAGNYAYIEWDSNPYRDAIAPGMFGGRAIPQRDNSVKLADQVKRHENNRTRMVEGVYLMIGDILIGSADADGSDVALYLYTGNGLLNLTTGKLIPAEEMDAHLVPFMAYNRFVVLRPSLMLDSK